MTSRKKAFSGGVKETAPILLGVVPYALISGIAMAGTGVSPLTAFSMSLVAFAGTAQLVVIELFAQQASIAVILFTALIVNLRYFMYSASLAPHFCGLSLRWRTSLAYLLTDQSYAISVSAYDNGMTKFKHWFYLGSAIAMWATWQAGAAVGIFLSAGIPQSWSLDFAIPLTFLALLISMLKDRPAIIAAVSAGVLALLGHSLPYNLGLISAAIGGLVIGSLADRGNRHAAG